MSKISLLHPFSAKAIGLKEKDLYHSHSKPQEKAMLKMQEEGYRVSIDYFTGNIFPYSKTVNGIKKNFWPVTSPLLRDRHKWRKQHSRFHYLSSYFSAPDLTIINMSGHGSRYCFKLAKLLRQKKKPYVAMIGGIHLSKEGEAKEYFQNAHHIIVHTEVQKQQMLQMETFSNLQFQVMPLGIDTETFSPRQRNNQNIELLFVGRISRLKQIELCLEAVSYLLKNQGKNVKLRVVGPVSDDSYFTELKAMATKLKITDNIDFVGMVAHEHLVSYFQKADLLLLPSAHESFGMVMIEAMACGAPVAALKGAGGPDEIVEDRINGILTTKESFSKRVLEFVQSEDKQNIMRHNARKMVEQKWSLEQTELAMRSSLNKVFS